MYELQSAATPTAAEAKHWIGKRVDDIHGKQIGRLSDIVEDPASGETIWMLIRYGPGGDACTLVPLREASRAPRRIWVRFSRDFVRNGPWIHRHTPMSARTGEEFARHYGLPVAAGTSGVRPAPASEPPTSVRPRTRRFAPAGVAAVSATQVALPR